MGMAAKIASLVLSPLSLRICLTGLAFFAPALVAAQTTQAPAPASASSDASAPSATKAPHAFAELQPYQLIRSLQKVQDAVVMGDHAALEMQRFLLGVIDQRLRKAEQTVFDDPRNVDAALIYAMSGGNPATLDLLALRDRFGNFDTEVTAVVQAYLDGQAARSKDALDEVAKLYGNQTIGPYLALVAANVKAGLGDRRALELFDLARLGAPGTIVEEAALRRAIFVANQRDLIDEAIHYAMLYSRRFPDSPYAEEFLDQLVMLVVDQHDRMEAGQIERMLVHIDKPRQREVYLRISRKAVINGLTELALQAADRARGLAEKNDKAPIALAGLYSGLAAIPSDKVLEIDRFMESLEEVRLSPRDEALRNAVRRVAHEIVRPPEPASLTQAPAPKLPELDETLPGQAEEGTAAAMAQQDPGTAGSQRDDPDADPGFQTYLDDREQLLAEIDGLLKIE
ncbi:chemotaxis protein [Pseudohoeflea coraliihabitans]|uniref:Chemotaxis protein n=1 Tax=Pseudohoeflea coraliihabitans TaxID=2860393 RepID=A0ABS6WN30_9HYPH|nr:chemotaxis protein [Pseudohoeflea sp. DP4N28-3]MBW3097358.1 chemotaxis protein [Pseudohoeflea sp. DP4N28-3]